MLRWGVGALALVACSDDSGGAGSDGSSSDGSSSDGSSSDGSSSDGSSSDGSSSDGSSSDGSSSDGSSGDPATCNADGTTPAHTAEVVEATEAWLATLTDTQRSAAEYDLTVDNAIVWSNFPTTFVQRNGVRIGDMSAAAQAAAEALVQVAAGDTGATLFAELRAADEWLVTDGSASSTDYGTGLYYFSVHGTPSTSEPWLLQVGGHHLAFNLLYNGPCLGATPFFDGSEPMDWTDGETQHAPLAAQRDAMVALVQSVASSADAKLSGSFGDLVNGPAGGGPGGGGGGDTKYPSSLSYPTGSTGRGVSVASLDDDQRALVKSAIEAWVNNVGDPVASKLLASYESDEALDQTYVGYAGESDLSTQGSYVRIDGPRVWIEVTVQGGIVYRNVVHWHTIWRDKVSDYAAEFGE